MSGPLRAAWRVALGGITEEEKRERDLAVRVRGAREYLRHDGITAACGCWHARVRRECSASFGADAMDAATASGFPAVCPCDHKAGGWACAETVRVDLSAFADARIDFDDDAIPF